MDSKTAEFFVECEENIKEAYEHGVAPPHAIKMAARFLHAQIKAGEVFKDADLDARMKKAGLKAIKASVYLGEAGKSEKKPSDVMLSALVDQHEKVRAAQKDLDTAEVYRDEIQNYLNVFREGHIYFRKIGGDTFNG